MILDPKALVDVLETCARPPLTRADAPDALFPTDNVFGVPVLDLRLQADFVHLPVMTWGATKRNQQMRGTWHFYTDDYRYERLWSDPGALVNTRCVAAAETNWTTSEQMPGAVVIWQTYRKRWMARYWQSFGIKIFVDLNVAPEFYVHNLLGVPAGWRSYMTRGYSDRLAYTQYEYSLAVKRAGTDDIIFAVYGGGDAVRAACHRQGWIHIPETMDIAKGKVPGG